MTEITRADMTADEARQFVALIRAAQEELPRRIIEAYQRRAWVSLGYSSWDGMCSGEGIQLRLPRDERQQIVFELRSAGMSTPAIGSALGIDQRTVRRDMGNGTSANAEVDLPDTITSLDGRQRSASRPEPRPEPQPVLCRHNVPLGRCHTCTPRPARPEPVMLTLRTHTGEEVPYPLPASRPTFNQTDGEGISWAAWSWNPVTGCLHGCDYCYARAIAHRFTDGFPTGFTPLFHHERLDAPANTTIPAAHRDDPAYRRVFVCSMADLYGRWVPDEWITRVHQSMLDSSQWEYLLLTKFPGRYVGLDLPPNAWVGTSVDEQKRVRIAEDAFRKIDGVKVKWLSLEPLREPLEFTDLSMFDWVVIGAQTETRQPTGVVPAFAPPFEWVARLYMQAKEAGCKIHMKPNLLHSPGMRLPNEYPSEV